MKTLLIDGDWNLKRNFLKRENMFAKGEHCGGSYGFLESLRTVVNKVMPDRASVMWDGMMGGKLRHDIYPGYKIDRDKSWDEDSYRMDEIEIGEEAKKKYSSLSQKIKVKNYLEELYVRQSEVEFVEADDLIAQYVITKPDDEQVYIFSTDKDYRQLIVKEGVSVIIPKKNETNTTEYTYLNRDNFKKEFGYIPDNILLLRCFEGDVSDSIHGVDGIAKKSLLKHFPRFADEIYDIDRLIQEAVTLYQSHPIKIFEKIIGSRSVIKRNDRLMNLHHPLLTEQAISEVDDLHNCIIVENEDFTKRSVANAMTMMVKDGYNKLVWNEDMNWFFQPFFRLVAKETEYSKKMING
jgi:5'-3' exonuclease